VVTDAWFGCRLSVAEQTAERISLWAGPRPDRPVEIRPCSDCCGLLTRHRPENFSERQLFELLTGRNRHTAAGGASPGERQVSNNCGHSGVEQFDTRSAMNGWCCKCRLALPPTSGPLRNPKASSASGQMGIIYLARDGCRIISERASFHR